MTNETSCGPPRLRARPLEERSEGEILRDIEALARRDAGEDSQ